MYDSGQVGKRKEVIVVVFLLMWCFFGVADAGRASAKEAGRGEGAGMTKESLRTRQASKRKLMKALSRQSQRQKQERV